MWAHDGCPGARAATDRKGRSAPDAVLGGVRREQIAEGVIHLAIRAHQKEARNDATGHEAE